MSYVETAGALISLLNFAIAVYNGNVNESIAWAVAFCAWIQAITNRRQAVDDDE